MVAAAEIEVQRAQALLKADPVEACRRLSESRQLNPTDPRIADELARLELRLGRWQDAFGHFKSVMALGTDSPEVWSLTGLCCLRLGQREEAQEYCTRALSGDPEQRIALEVLADCHKIVQQWREAANGYRFLISRLTPSLESARARVEFKLAECLLRQGAYSAAWEIANGLAQRGFAAKEVRLLLRESEKGNRRELSAALGTIGRWERILLWVASKPLTKVLSMVRHRRVAPYLKETDAVHNIARVEASSNDTKVDRQV